MRSYSISLFLSAAFIAISVYNTSAQVSQMAVAVKSTEAGQQIMGKEYVDVKGSQYSTNDWAKGSIKQSDGKVKDGVFLLYSEVKDAVYFKGDKDEMFEYTPPIADFTLTYTDEDNKQVEKHYHNEYPPVDGNTILSYYQVLCDGKTQLLKKNVKTISSTKEFGSATTTSTFMNNTSYYIFVSGKITAVKKDKKSIFNALGNKQTELDAFIKTSKLSLKNDDDLAKLISYYNTL